MSTLAPQLQAISFSIIDLLLTLSLSFVLGFWEVFIYRTTHSGLTYERSFLVSLTLMPPIVALVMMFIGSNLALSLGMIGALSIIRFRTVIKDSRDMVYLFWAIAIGLGCGTMNWMASIVSSGFFGLILFVINFLRYGRTNHSNFVLVVTGGGKTFNDAVMALVSDHASYSTMRSLEINGDGWEIVVELRLDGTDDAFSRQLLEKIRDIPDISNASLLAPHLALPI